jgi:adenine-specific DNA-methyltransferase
MLYIGDKKLMPRTYILNTKGGFSVNSAKQPDLLVTPMILDEVRLKVSAKLDQERRAEYGQFMTPTSIARFMVSLFPADEPMKTVRLLDAGAGVGSLSSAFLDWWESGGFQFDSVAVTAYEIDSTVRKYLTRTLADYAERLPLDVNVQTKDFIEAAVRQIEGGQGPHFTHAILNPPYRKINSDSHHRLLLRRVGIETVNLYSAFVALAVALMEPKGQVVAIIPRSFCNGPYYRPFREFLRKHAAIHHIHLFNARNKAFKDDAVLQENVIILLERDGVQGPVAISTSTDDSFLDYQVDVHPSEHIVRADDPEIFIHVPTSSGQNGELPSTCRFSLADLGIEVSTGPVVDFRVKEHLREMPGKGSVPLLYPAHFSGQSMQWPIKGSKKPNALMRNAHTERSLFPRGFYAVTRRFSSKEEKRRIIAGMVTPDAFQSDVLGFENHLNVFHHGKRGLPEALARGLVVYLSATTIDDHFRRFSGHTQVNATDLRQMKYPSREILSALGTWAAKRELTQETIDQKVAKYA